MEKKFMVKLVSIASAPKEQTNAKGDTTKFYPCTVELTTPTGTVEQFSARIFEGSYAKGVTVGEVYSSLMKPYVDSKGENQVDLVVFHTQSAPRPSFEMFFGSPVVVPTTAIAFEEEV